MKAISTTTMQLKDGSTHSIHDLAKRGTAFTMGMLYELEDQSIDDLSEALLLSSFCAVKSNLMTRGVVPLGYFMLSGDGSVHYGMTQHSPQSELGMGGIERLILAAEIEESANKVNARYVVRIGTRYGHLSYPDGRVVVRPNLGDEACDSLLTVTATDLQTRQAMRWMCKMVGAEGGGIRLIPGDQPDDTDWDWDKEAKEFFEDDDRQNVAELLPPGFEKLDIDGSDEQSWGGEPKAMVSPDDARLALAGKGAGDLALEIKQKALNPKGAMLRLRKIMAKLGDTKGASA